jgi:ABC-type multidrug transport system fused ATPase/permease subunit
VRSLRKLLGYFSDVWKLLGSDRRRVIPIVLVLILSSALDLIGLGLIGGYITVLSSDPDAAGANPMIEKLVDLMGGESPVRSLGIALILLFTFKAFLGIGAQRLIIAFSLRQMMSLRVRVFNLMQLMPYQDFVRLNSASLIRAIVSYTTQFNVVIMSLLKLLGDAILAIAIILFLAILEPLLMLAVGLMGLCVVFFWDRLFRKNLAFRGREMNEGDGLLLQGVQEGAQGFKEIKILGAERFFRSLVKQGAEMSMAGRLYTGTVSAAPRFVIECIAVCFIVVFSWATLSRGLSATSIFAVLGVFAIAAVRLAPLATQGMFSVSQLRASKPAIDGLIAQIEAAGAPREPASQSVARSHSNFNELRLENVEFGYNPDAPALLSNVSLVVRRGDWIGIVGESGTGKTTLIDTILGLIEPQSGKIFYNGKALADSLGDWQANVAYIPQETLIIDSSLAENIILGKAHEGVVGQKLTDALKKSRLETLVRSLPMGVEARLGERGSLISGGQRQRVAIARALYYDRQVLILDEATSALDLKTEREILHELKDLGNSVTVIAVSHRLETLAMCDIVYRVEGARLIRMRE